jgi:hypothetical protein
MTHHGAPVTVTRVASGVMKKAVWCGVYIGQGGLKLSVACMIRVKGVEPDSVTRHGGDACRLAREQG